jgi:glutamate racemase
LSELRASINAPIVELGDEAHMPYGEREVRFVREDGIWKIDDPD